MSKGKSIAAVASQLDVCRDTIYEWRDAYPEFAEALSKGRQRSQEYWENLGHDGIAGNIKNFSGNQWSFVMKTRFREDYAEKKEEKTHTDSLIEKLLEKL